MPRILRYLTHPQVQIDADVPVPQWGLSDIGRQRTLMICKAAVLAPTTTIISSNETKAVETGAIIAEALGLELQCRELMHENDRSATGFLEPSEFEAVADQFFANPETSIRGWERAIDAQARIVGEALDVLGSVPGNGLEADGDILLVGHGGVGTLLYCHLAGKLISRSEDQISGGGCYFSYDLNQRQMLHHWQKMEDLK